MLSGNPAQKKPRTAEQKQRTLNKLSDLNAKLAALDVRDKNLSKDEKAEQKK